MQGKKKTWGMEVTWAEKLPAGSGGWHRSDWSLLSRSRQVFKLSPSVTSTVSSSSQSPHTGTVKSHHCNLNPVAWHICRMKPEKSTAALFMLPLKCNTSYLLIYLTLVRCGVRGSRKGLSDDFNTTCGRKENESWFDLPEENTWTECSVCFWNRTVV